HGAAPLRRCGARERAARLRRRGARPRQPYRDARRRAADADGEGVRPAVVPRLASAARLLARPADGPRLGPRERDRHRHRHGPRAAAPREDRGRPRPSRPPEDRLGRRLPARPVIELALIVSAASLLAGLAFLSVSVPLAAVLLSGWVMFHMGADLKILIVATGAASAAVIASLVLARSIARSIRRVGASSEQLTRGDLTARAPVGGPAEIARLAESFNTMAASIE